MKAKSICDFVSVLFLVLESSFYEVVSSYRHSMQSLLEGMENKKKRTTCNVDEKEQNSCGMNRLTGFLV